MKDFKWSQKAAPHAKIGALLTCLALSLSAAADGNGGGYGGGETKGVSAPLTVVRSITLDAAQKVVEICAVKGDPANGRKSMFEKFLVSAYGFKAPIQASAQVYVTPLPGPGPLSYTPTPYINMIKLAASRADMQDPQSYTWGSVQLDQGSGGQWVNQPKDPTIQEFRLEISFQDPDSPSDKVEAATELPIPTLHFESIIKNKIPDQWGHIDTKKDILKNVSIEFENLASAQTKLFPIDDAGNFGTEALPVTLNTADYVQCLHEELSRAGQN